MEVIIQPDAGQAADLPARLIATRLRAKPDQVLGLATGRTMDRVYWNQLHRPFVKRRSGFVLEINGKRITRCPSSELIISTVAPRRPRVCRAGRLWSGLQVAGTRHDLL